MAARVNSPMGRVSIALGAIAASLWIAAGSTAVADTATVKMAHCAPRGVHVVAANLQAEVYETNGPEEPREAYGCAAHGRAYLLGHYAESSSGGGGGVYREVLAGTMVAYGKESIPGAQAPSDIGSVNLVLVRNLRTGRVAHNMPTGTAPNGSANTGVGKISSMVLKSDGSVAWIAGGEASPVEYQVRVVDRRGERLLASGADVGTQSLRLKGSRISWTQGGRRFSSPLH